MTSNDETPDVAEMRTKVNLWLTTLDGKPMFEDDPQLREKILDALFRCSDDKIRRIYLKIPEGER